jgi:hypothetical protein
MLSGESIFGLSNLAIRAAMMTAMGLLHDLLVLSNDKESPIQTRDDRVSSLKD